MRRIAALVLAMLATPAAACLPPLPGEVAPPIPTEEDRAQSIVRGSDTIAYGVLTGGTEDGRDARFRVIHVYKGTVRPGAIVRVKPSWGFDPPMCAGMMGGPPPSLKGEYGVVAWSGEPALNWISDQRLAIMFDRGWIVRATPKVPAPR